MKRFLITGVSSGIGRALTKKLVTKGNIVWGVARRGYLLEDLKKELKNPPKFIYSTMDVSRNEAWEKLISQMVKIRFTPDVVIFNAAVLLDDLVSGLETELTRKIFDINFFSVMEGMKNLLKIVQHGSQFVAISSSSALKGSGIEGVGYPASKAALSIAFESLHQKYKHQYSFKVIYFGPIDSGMGPFKKRFHFILSESQAVEKIISVVKDKNSIYYYPVVLFLFLRIIKLLPSRIYFFLLSEIEKFHKKLQRESF